MTVRTSSPAAWARAVSAMRSVGRDDELVGREHQFRGKIGLRAWIGLIEQSLTAMLFRVGRVYGSWAEMISQLSVEATMVTGEFTARSARKYPGDQRLPR